MTIPGFTANLSTVQNHIHLGVKPLDGSGPTGFGAHGEPPYRYTVQKRLPHFEFQGEFDRSWIGTPFVHILKTSDGSKPLTYQDLQYTMKVTLAQLDELEAMLGWPAGVYLVDHRHCGDTADHTMYVKLMFFAEINYNDHYDPLLNNNEIVCLFKDMNTVSPL